MIFPLLLALTCHVPQADKILARELAGIEPAFAALPPEQAMSYAPRPGLQRVFSPAELSGLAERNGIPYSPSGSICFEWPTRLLNAEEVRTALLAAAGPQAEVDLLDYSKMPVPQGSIVFPRPALSPRGIWKGYVEYTRGKRVEVWARVRVRAPYVRLVTTADITAGTALNVGQLRVERGVGPDLAPAWLESAEVAIGRVTRRWIPSGTPVTEGMLQRPRSVARGEPVTVDVKSGTARISFSGTAESAGSVGDIVPVRNPETRRVVRARVTGPGRAVLVLGHT